MRDCTWGSGGACCTAASQTGCKALCLEGHQFQGQCLVLERDFKTGKEGLVINLIGNRDITDTEANTNVEMQVDHLGSHPSLLGMM